MFQEQQRGKKLHTLPILYLVNVFLFVALALLTFTFVRMEASKLPEAGLTTFGF
jgi:hypothetical protein